MGARSGNRLSAADRALNRYYTSAVGGRAQSYEPATPDSDHSPEEAIMSRWRCAERAAFAETQAILGKLPVATRNVLASVYGRRAGVLSNEAGLVRGIIKGRRDRDVDRLGLLRLALQPTWGHGSFVGLAVEQPRAQREYAKRFPDAPTPASDKLLSFLCDEAGAGQQRARFLAQLRDDCEAVRTEALTVFDEVRRAAIQSKIAAEEAERERELARAADLRSRAAERDRQRLPACLRWSDEERREMQARARELLAELGIEAAS